MSTQMSRAMLLFGSRKRTPYLSQRLGKRIMAYMSKGRGRGISAGLHP